jgi:carboxynorspermidine decarboxylase
MNDDIPRTSPVSVFDPHCVPSPCFVLDETALRRNVEVLRGVRDRAGVTFLLALKGFAMRRAFPAIRAAAAGATASSLHEARLGCEGFGAPVHAYAPAYREDEWDAWRGYASHVTFNSLAQLRRFAGRLGGVSAGLRVNPEYSEARTELYNPCAPGSRLGVRAAQLAGEWPAGLDGLHVHNLCENDSRALEKTIANLERLFASQLPRACWINLGGGHLITRAGYDREHLVGLLQAFRARHPAARVILEPGAAFAWRAGVLVATVLDVVESDGVETAVLDTSFAAHMPDCLEMPYTPEVRGARIAAAGERGMRLGGLSCLAGDFVGDYVFERKPAVGERVVFEDMMHYTMVKTNMFNGVNLPAIGIWREAGGFERVREFGYEDYAGRLG